MEPDGSQEQNKLSQQEKEGIGYLWLTILGIVACLLIFFVIYLLVT